MQTTNKGALKLAAAQEVPKYVLPDRVLGIGRGSTVTIFIALLKDIAHSIPGAVAASHSSADALRDTGIAVLDPNAVSDVAVYVDGADEVDDDLMLIKGGGAALTREKYSPTRPTCSCAWSISRNEWGVLISFLCLPK